MKTRRCRTWWRRQPQPTRRQRPGSGGVAVQRGRDPWCAGLLTAAALLTAGAAGAARGEWPQHGFDAAEARYSPLAAITPANVARLAPVWFADLSAISHRAFEATPIVVDGRLYLSTPWSVAIAFDARSGRELWRYDPKVSKAVAGKGCCGPVSRGVAVAGGRVFLATFDGRLLALAAANGRLLWSTSTVDGALDYTITGAPRVVGHQVLIGNGGAELGVRGYLSAYDTETGKLVWRFYTVPPRPGVRDGAASDAVLESRAAPTWAGRWWDWGGGGTVWDAMAYDAKLDLLYIGVGNGGPWNRQLRSAGRGDNLFLSSIIALRPRTGEYVWHFQETPGDEWDYTATQSIILADLKLDGRVR
ncbi:MAG: PQQ-binding-like beta-propeller repeat protein, partial [Gammaproteobacteria bacterium]|nr:PQQ-binding-like beta-propeller repeat protein [Gammaproteobacteria bacterium]